MPALGSIIYSKTVATKKAIEKETILHLARDY